MPFVLLKGLSFLPFGGLLKNPKVLIGGVLILVLAFAYIKFKNSIKETIYNQIFTEQAEQHIENQQRELERQRALMREENEAVRRAQAQRAQLLREIESARSLTRNVDPEQNGEVAPVLEEALSFIRARQGVQVPREPTIGQQVGEAVDRSQEAVRDAGEAVQEGFQTGNRAIDAWRARQRER